MSVERDIDFHRIRRFRVKPVVRSLPALTLLLTICWVVSSVPAKDRPVEDETDGSNQLSKPVAVLTGSGGLNVKFLDEGRKIFTAGKRQARIWDGQTYEPLTEPMTQPNYLTSAAVSSDGDVVVTAG